MGLRSPECGEPGKCLIYRRGSGHGKVSRPLDRAMEGTSVALVHLLDESQLRFQHDGGQLLIGVVRSRNVTPTCRTSSDSGEFRESDISFWVDRITFVRGKLEPYILPCGK